MTDLKKNPVSDAFTKLVQQQYKKMGLDEQGYKILEFEAFDDTNQYTILDG